MKSLLLYSTNEKESLLSMVFFLPIQFKELYKYKSKIRLINDRVHNHFQFIFDIGILSTIDSLLMIYNVFIDWWKLEHELYDELYLLSEIIEIGTSPLQVLQIRVIIGKNILELYLFIII